MEKWELVIIRIREFFRKDNQTNWGKNQIVKLLDDIEEKIRKEIKEV